MQFCSGLDLLRLALLCLDCGRPKTITICAEACFWEKRSAEGFGFWMSGGGRAWKAKRWKNQNRRTVRAALPAAISNAPPVPSSAALPHEFEEPSSSLYLPRDIAKPRCGSEAGHEMNHTCSLEVICGTAWSIPSPSLSSFLLYSRLCCAVPAVPQQLKYEPERTN